MMPPTSIDGTDITGATIDGTDVTEITVDGQTVFTAGGEFGEVSLYEFENNANDTVGSNNGTFVNGAFSANAEYGSFAGDFNGTDAALQIEDDPSISGLSEITLSIWVNPNSLSSVNMIWSKGSDTSNDFSREWFWRIETDGTMILIFTSGNTTDFRLDSSGTIPTGTYTHLAATYDGSQMKLFINGLEDTSRSVSGSIQDDSGKSLIGAQTDGNGGSASSAIQFFDGLMDQARIFDRALTTSEISDLFNE